MEGLTSVMNLFCSSSMSEVKISTQEREPLLGRHDEKNYTLDNAIEAIGIGKFHIFLMLITGFAWIAESMEVTVISVLSPILVCEWSLSSFEQAMIATLLFIGMGLGSSVWGCVSDKFGRKKSLIYSFSLILLFGILSSQAPSYGWILLFQTFLGFGIGGGPQVPVIVTEMLPLRHRGRAVIMLALFWAVGSVFVASLALAIIDLWKWRTFLLIVSSPLVIFLMGSYWIPESPRYLLSTGQISECKSVLEKIAKWNGKMLPDGDLTGGVPLKQNRTPLLSLFSKPLYRTTIALLILWFSLTYSYYGVVLLTTSMLQTDINGCHPHATSNMTYHPEGCKRLSAKDYRDVITTTVAEFPGTLIAYVLINGIGRRKAILAQLLISTLSFVLLSVCSSRMISTILVFTARGLLSGCAQTTYVYSAEVFPTNVRAVGVGLGSTIGRIGAMVTPFAAQVLIYESFYLLIAAYVFPLVLCIFAALSLKVETSQRLLEESSGGLYASFEKS